MAEKMNDGNIHAGHRKRMWKRFMENGIAGFSEHEVIEMLLYACYPRRNTNDIAHELLRRFGSIKGVIDADHDDLCSVDNVGDSAAAFICFLRQFAVAYAEDALGGILLRTSEDARVFCSELMRECTAELAYVLYLDHSMALSGTQKLSKGNDNHVEFDIKAIATRAIKGSTPNVVLAHNHPNGVAMPTSRDVATTRRIAMALRNVGVELLDHIVVAEGDGYSMRTAGLLPDIWM